MNKDEIGITEAQKRYGKKHGLLIWIVSFFIKDSMLKKFYKVLDKMKPCKRMEFINGLENRYREMYCNST